MTWSLYQNEKFLKPLIFSNGKTQEEIVKEVLNLIKQNKKIIFIHGVCGTGKSAIALNIAKNLGKTSIVVPGKNLQSQYKKDYEGEKYLLKKNNEKLKISVITGRNNHKCKFLEDSQSAIPKIKQEINAKLHDIFAGKRQELSEIISEDISADNWSLPCKIEIKEKNLKKIKDYLRQNKKNVRDFDSIKDVKRISLAGACPYWSPVMLDKYELNLNAQKRDYSGINGKNFVFYQRKQGCSFYEQFHSYIDSDVIVFNSQKYKLESTLDRKPLTEVEIIDECDEFLDSFANSRILNIERLQNSLIHVFGSYDTEKILREMQEIIKQIKKNTRIEKAVYSQEIIPLRETGIFDLFKIVLQNPEIFEEIDDESYVFELEEIARMFEDFLGESFVTFAKKDGALIASIVTTNLEKKFKEMVDKNKFLVLMSGTLHSDEVLKKIFGLENFEKIDAEVEQQGQIEVVKTGLEEDCKYSNFSNGKHSREKYLKALSKCVEAAKKPVLVHVNAFSDLPTDSELEEFDIDNLISQKKLGEHQKKDKTGEAIERFKKGQIEILFSTRSSRGVDFPGTQCNSIIFTKYPNPNVQDAFWKILNKTNPENYWNFYQDKARRELLQKVYRGLRFKEDHVFVLSPDSRVLDSFEKD